MLWAAFCRRSPGRGVTSSLARGGRGLPSVLGVPWGLHVFRALRPGRSQFTRRRHQPWKGSLGVQTARAAQAEEKVNEVWSFEWRVWLL